MVTDASSGMGLATAKAIYWSDRNVSSEMSGGAPMRTGGPRNRHPGDVELGVVHCRQSGQRRLRESDDVVEWPHLTTVRVTRQLQVHSRAAASWT